VQSENLKTLKTQKINGGWGESFLNWWVFTPLGGGCKNITAGYYNAKRYILTKLLLAQDELKQIIASLMIVLE